MKRRHIIRPLAEQDIIETALYIAADNIEVAERFTFAVQATIDKLSRMPEIGSPQMLKNPELAGLRMWPVAGFDKLLIYYVPREDRLDIIRILHSARDREALLNR